MAGYKRVNFYELCRLCASNQQKDKTHIFQEEGKKIQLQNKIQSCLSLNVCENDFLPKVVCSKCLRTLEVCYSFRQECVSSESMLSSYFKNFRYTEDFKKSGKVYIKDTAVPKPPTTTVTTTLNLPQHQLPQAVVQHTSAAPDPPAVQAPSYVETKPLDVPFYTLQLPTIVSTSTATSHQPLVEAKQSVKLIDSKIIQHSSSQTPIPSATTTTQQTSHVAYTNTINFVKTVKSEQPQQAIVQQQHQQHQQQQQQHQQMSNVVVNANGEVLNIAQLVDFEALLNVQKAKQQKQQLKRKQEPASEPVAKIDLTSEPEKRPPKFAYVKLEENKQIAYATTTSDFQGQYNGYPAYTSEASGSSTVNLNALSQDFNKSFGVAPVTTTTTTTASTSPPKPVVAAFNGNADVKAHVCEICQKSFKRREHLYQHVKLHTGFRPYTCENCNKSFMRKEHLLRHMISHSGAKNFTCNICDKSFSRNDNLLKHKKTHDKQASYTCEVCQKQFVMKHYYLAHKHTHDGTDNKCGGMAAPVAAASTLTNVWNTLKT